MSRILCHRCLAALLLIVAALLTTAPANAQDLNAFALQVYQLVNDERVNAGVRPLVRASELDRAAQKYSQAMADGGFFSHVSPDGSTPLDRIVREGYNFTTASENIAYGYQTPDEVVAGWMNSPGHRANILYSRVTEIGVGVAVPAGTTGPIYWTLDFGSRPGGPPQPVVASLAVSPTQVIGGNAATGTVSLVNPAPPGGAGVTLVSSDPLTAIVSGSATVADGTSTATFAITTQPVTASVSVTISASLNGVTKAATLALAPPDPPATLVVSALTLSLTTVTGGSDLAGTITLSGPAPPDGAVVALSSSRTDVGAPPSVTVAAGMTTATFAIKTGPVTAAVAADISASLGGAGQTVTLTLLPPDGPAPASGRIAIFRPSGGEWWVRAADGTSTPIILGDPGDQPVPADYLGIGRVQIAVFRPATQQWLIRTPTGDVVTVPFGAPGDQPVPGDYLGFGWAQIAVFRPSTQEWFIRSDSDTTASVQWGGTGDQPVPADYSGLGRVQIAVFRPATGQWFLRDDSGLPVEVHWGIPGDRPLPADYLGLQRAQVAIFRPTTGEWFLRNDDGTATRILWGDAGDEPVPGDYLNLGRAQIAIFRPGTGDWLLRLDSGLPALFRWGIPGDIPVSTLLGE